MIAITPLVNRHDIEAVARQMRTQWIGRTCVVDDLGERMADWVGVRYAMPVGSGTAALTAALQTLSSATVCVAPGVCDAVCIAIKFAGKRLSARSRTCITVFPERGGDIEDFARHLPRRGYVKLRGRFGVFSFGALKDVTGGLGGCLVSSQPIPENIRVWERLSPLSAINAAMIHSQLDRYTGHYTLRQVAGGFLWAPPA